MPPRTRGRALPARPHPNAAAALLLALGSPAAMIALTLVLLYWWVA